MWINQIHSENKQNKVPCFINLSACKQNRTAKTYNNGYKIFFVVKPGDRKQTLVAVVYGIEMISDKGLSDYILYTVAG